MDERKKIIVSIIVPVYNTAKYLENSVASLINQSYRNIEIILIDDGSTDASWLVCNELAKRDRRIRVIHQENQGVSAARNNATKIASGKYVMYFDSDDILERCAIQKAVAYACEYNADMVIGAVAKIHSIDEFQAYDVDSDTVYEILADEQYDELRRQFLHSGEKKYSTVKGAGYFNRAPHAQLIRYDIALVTNFPANTPIGEDLLWNMRLLRVCKTIVLVYDIWYAYVMHESSAVRRYHGDRAQKVSEYLIQLKNENEGFFENNIDAYVRNVAVELYCIANYELLLRECPMMTKQKVRFIKDIIQKEPWNILYKDRNWTRVPLIHQMMLLLYKTGMWIVALRIKKHKKTL